MPKSEPIQKNADDVNLFASKKETDCVVDCNLADVLGAPPCNTAPPKCTDTAIIRAGIDSLYLSFRGSPKRILVDELQSLKEAA